MAGYFQFPFMYGNMQGQSRMQQRAPNMMNAMFLQGALDGRVRSICQSPISSPNEQVYPSYMLREARNDLIRLMWSDSSIVWDGIRKKTGIDFLNCPAQGQGWGIASCEFSHANLRGSVLGHTLPPEIEQLLRSRSLNTPSPVGSSDGNSDSPAPGTSGEGPSALSSSAAATTPGHHTSTMKPTNEPVANRLHNNMTDSSMSTQKRGNSDENELMKSDNDAPPKKRIKVDSSPIVTPAMAKTSVERITSRRILSPTGLPDSKPQSSSIYKPSVIDSLNRPSLSSTEQDSGIFSPSSPHQLQDTFSSPVLKNV